MSENKALFKAIAKLVGEARVQIEEKFSRSLDAIDLDIDALQSITPEKGDQGEPGPTGEQGLQGEPGATGEKGDAGDQGHQGEQGIPGDTGQDGLTGPQGDKGDTGSDGIDRPLIQPVALKAGREYPKNTVGTHAGGLWVSSKHAVGDPEEDPHAWACILDGFNSLSMKHLDGQVFQLSLRQASGATLEHGLRLPIPMHKGVFEEDRIYYPGEIVTKGTAMWQAEEPTDHAPPGNGWTQILTAPRGRKGEKGTAGEDADQDVVDEMRATIKRMNELAVFFEDLRDGLIGDEG